MNDRREGAHALVLAAFALAHVLLFTVVFHTVYRIAYSGIGLYFDFASKLVHGGVPYRDFALEYPPFALVFFTLPRLAASTLAGYSIWFEAEAIVADLVILGVLAAIARRRNIPAWPTLGAYTLAVAALGPIVGQQFDLFPAALTAGALYCFWRERHFAGWMLVALGTLTKLYPLLTAPIWLLAFAGGQPRRYAVRAAAVFVGTSIVVLSPLLVTSPSSLRSFFAYHAERGIQLESSYATVILLADKIGLTWAGTGMSFGSWNVTGAAARAMTPLSTVVFLAAMAGAVLFLRRHPARRAGPEPVSIEWLASAMLFVLALALLTSKVLSPQYLIWLLPSIPLVSGRRCVALWTGFVIAGLLTYYIFPMHYIQLIGGETSSEVVLLVRNLLLVAVAGLAALSVRDSSGKTTP